MRLKRRRLFLATMRTYGRPCRRTQAQPQSKGDFEEKGVKEFLLARIRDMLQEAPSTAKRRELRL